MTHLDVSEKCIMLVNLKNVESNNQNNLPCFIAFMDITNPSVIDTCIHIFEKRWVMNSYSDNPSLRYTVIEECVKNLDNFKSEIINNCMNFISDYWFSDNYSSDLSSRYRLIESCVKKFENARVDLFEDCIYYYKFDIIPNLGNTPSLRYQSVEECIDSFLNPISKLENFSDDDGQEFIDIL